MTARWRLSGHALRRRTRPTTASPRTRTGASFGNRTTRRECFGASRPPRSTLNTRDGPRSRCKRGDILLFVFYRPASRGERAGDLHRRLSLRRRLDRELESAAPSTSCSPKANGPGPPRPRMTPDRRRDEARVRASADRPSGRGTHDRTPSRCSASPPPSKRRSAAAPADRAAARGWRSPWRYCSGHERRR